MYVVGVIKASVRHDQRADVSQKEGVKNESSSFQLPYEEFEDGSKNADETGLRTLGLIFDT